MGDDKPFQCTEPGCGMRFTNEDHLGVHKAKHELSLTLTAGNSKSGNIIAFVADQTPTPTKFLRNCEEIGLFHELTKNPFEEAFRKAFAEGKVQDLHESSPFPGPLGDNESVMHTPNPGLLLSVMDDDHARREKLVSCKPTATSTNASDAYIPLPGPNTESGSTLIAEICSKVTESSNSSPVGVMSSIGKPVQRWKCNSSAVLLKQDASTAEHDGEQHLDSPLGHDSSQDSLTLGESSATSLTQANPVLSMLPPGTSLVPVSADSAGGICYLQVMIKSPTGEVVPVQIPATLSTAPVTVVAAGVGDTVKVSPSGTPGGGGSGKPARPFASLAAALPSASPSSSTSMGIASTTKQRLKAAIRQNVQQSVLQSNLQVMSDAVDFVTTQLQLQQQHQGSPGMPCQVPPTSLVASEEDPGCLVRMSSEVQLQDADTSTPKKPRLSTDDDPDERRKKSLERNRAAAARCRMKKKVWVTNLEQKAEDLQSANDRLQTEVVQLRNEVVQLRTRLLAHRDCPVTQRQRAVQGAIKTEMQSDDVTSSSPVAVTPNAEEIAMVALSSMASRSHASRVQPVIVAVSELLSE